MNQIEYYFKVTKQCNLRCLYCHEQENYKHLQTLNAVIIKKIFTKILFFHTQYKVPRNIRLFYTGGEILIMGKKWMRDILRLQNEIFGKAKIKYATTIQTNLTLLDQEWIDIFKEHNIQIGASLDFFAKTRPFKETKRDSAPAVLDKLIELAENKINFGIIIVVTRQNYNKGEAIYNALNMARLSFHVLPLHPDSIKYCPELEISPEEYAQFLIDIAKSYLGPRNRIRVFNLEGFAALIKHGYPARGGLCTTKRNCWEGSPRLFFENTGETYFCGCFCEPEVLLGNVFKDSIAKMFVQLDSKKTFKKLASRYKIIQKLCRGCKFLPICNGGCPSFAYQEGDMFSKSKFYCAVNKKVFTYLAAILRYAPQKLKV